MSKSKKVSVFVCGVQKGGTTSLHEYFSRHPALSRPLQLKELHFFDRETIDWEAPDYSILEQPFDEDDGDRIRFEITPIYGFWPPALGRLRAYNPDAKLIFIFRDPFERAWSHWCMQYARAAERLPFAQAIRREQKRLQAARPLGRKKRIYSYVERGRYGQEVERALGFFPADQLLFLRSEDFRNDHKAVLAQVAAFLGIGAFPKLGRIRVHEQPKIDYPSMPTDEDRRYIASILAEDLDRFARHTKLDISNWPTAQLAATLQLQPA